MSFNFLKDFYNHIHSTLVWIVVYFILQTLIWAGLAVLIMLFPEALFLLAVIFFIALAAMSLYFGIMIWRLVVKLGRVKKRILG